MVTGLGSADLADTAQAIRQLRIKRVVRAWFTFVSRIR